MNDVVVEHKNRGRIISIEQITLTRVVLMMAEAAIVDTTKTDGPFMYNIAPMREPPIPRLPKTKKRSWKRRHAGKSAPTKQYARHTHRVKGTPHVRGLFISKWA